MNPSRFNFAPVSASPSTMVRVASGWFIVNGAAYGIMLVAILVTLALRPPPAIKWWAFITNILMDTTAVVFGVIGIAVLISVRDELTQ